MAKYSSDEARWRVRMKRVLRLNKFDSSYINNLETSELETIVTPFQAALEVMVIQFTAANTQRAICPQLSLELGL